MKRLRVTIELIGGYWTLCIRAQGVMSYPNYKAAWEAAYDLLTA